MGEFFGSPVKLPKTELPQCCVHPTIRRYFLLKKMRDAFALQKLLTFFQQKILVYMYLRY